MQQGAVDAEIFTEPDRSPPLALHAQGLTGSRKPRSVGLHKPSPDSAGRELHSSSLARHGTWAVYTGPVSGRHNHFICHAATRLSVSHKTMKRSHA